MQPLTTTTQAVELPTEPTRSIYQFDKDQFFAYANTIQLPEGMSYADLTDGECDTKNEYLIYIYSESLASQYGISVHDIEFKTFKQWKEEGRKIKKGSKAYSVFSAPKKIKARATEQDQKSQQPAGEDDKKTRKVYFRCCLFVNLDTVPA